MGGVRGVPAAARARNVLSTDSEDEPRVSAHTDKIAPAKDDVQRRSEPTGKARLRMAGQAAQFAVALVNESEGTESNFLGSVPNWISCVALRRFASRNRASCTHDEPRTHTFPHPPAPNPQLRAPAGHALSLRLQGEGGRWPRVLRRCLHPEPASARAPRRARLGGRDRPRLNHLLRYPPSCLPCCLAACPAALLLALLSCCSSAWRHFHPHAPRGSRPFSLTPFLIPSQPPPSLESRAPSALPLAPTPPPPSPLSPPSGPTGRGLRDGSLAWFVFRKLLPFSKKGEQDGAPLLLGTERHVRRTRRDVSAIRFAAARTPAADNSSKAAAQSVHPAQSATGGDSAAAHPTAGGGPGTGSTGGARSVVVCKVLRANGGGEATVPFSSLRPVEKYRLWLAWSHPASERRRDVEGLRVVSASAQPQRWRVLQGRNRACEQCLPGCWAWKH